MLLSADGVDAVSNVFADADADAALRLGSTHVVDWMHVASV